MMRWIVLVALVGCSGAAALSVDGDDVVEPETDGGSSGTTSSSSGSSKDGGSSSSSGTSSSSSSSSSGGSSSSGSTSSSSSSSGSSSGEVEDAGEDAAPDASVADAAPDAPPPVCNDGADRCVSYHEEACVAGQWARQDGEACCFTQGRYVSSGGGWYNDTVSPSVVQIHSVVRPSVSHAAAWNYCDTALGARMATKEQVLSLVLPSDGACVPGVDEGVFTEGGGNVTTSVFFVRTAPDDPGSTAKCVDLTTGQDSPCGAVAKPGVICVL